MALAAIETASRSPHPINNSAAKAPVPRFILPGPQPATSAHEPPSMNLHLIFKQSPSIITNTPLSVPHHNHHHHQYLFRPPFHSYSRPALNLPIVVLSITMNFFFFWPIILFFFPHPFWRLNGITSLIGSENHFSARRWDVRQAPAAV